MDKPKARPTRPSKCQVCSHPDRARLELLRVSGVSLVLARLVTTMLQMGDDGRDRVAKCFRAICAFS